MDEANARVTHSHSPEAAASMARLRALARPGWNLRETAKSISPTEIAAVVVLLFAAVAIILVYSFSILPDQVRRVQLSSAQAANRERIEQLEQQARNPATVQEEISAVQTSLSDFRGTYLKPRVAGSLAIIETVRNLTRETGVQLASPVKFTTSLGSEAVEEGPAREGPAREGSGRSRRVRKREADITAFSSLGLGFSIRGTYPQLRSFISGFERSPQFVVINSISLSSERELPTPGNGRRAAAPALSGSVITLNISMTAYFQPDAGFAAALPASFEAGPGQ